LAHCQLASFEANGNSQETAFDTKGDIPTAFSLSSGAGLNATLKSNDNFRCEDYEKQSVSKFHKKS